MFLYLNLQSILYIMKIKQLHDYFLHILEKQLSIQCKNQLPVFILGSGDATLQFSFNFIRIHLRLQVKSTKKIDFKIGCCGLLMPS